MEDHPRVRKKPVDVKVHIRRMNNNIILSGIPGEHKENDLRRKPHRDIMISREGAPTDHQTAEKNGGIYICHVRSLPAK